MTYIAPEMGSAGQASQQNCLWMAAQRDGVRDATDQIIDGLGTMAISGSSMESVLSPITADSRNFEEDYKILTSGSMTQSQSESKIQRMDVPSSNDVLYVEWTHARSAATGFAGVDLRRTKARCTMELGFVIQNWVPERMLKSRGSTRATV
jgi:hypothetical protein